MSMSIYTLITNTPVESIGIGDELLELLPSLLLDTGPLWDSEARPKWYRVNPNLYYLIDHDQRSLSSNVV